MKRTPKMLLLALIAQLEARLGQPATDRSLWSISCLEDYEAELMAQLSSKTSKD